MLYHKLSLSCRESQKIINNNRCVTTMVGTRNNDMTPQELIKYELPSYTEYVSIGWLQNIIARYYCKKVNKKYARYKMRLQREKFIKSIIK